MSQIIRPELIKPYEKFPFLNNQPKKEIADFVKAFGAQVPKNYFLGELDKARFENPQSKLLARSESIFEFTLPVSDLANSVEINEDDTIETIMQRIISQETYDNALFLEQFYQKNPAFPSRKELLKNFTASIWEYIPGLNHTIWEDSNFDNTIHILSNNINRKGLYTKIEDGIITKQYGDILVDKNLNKAVLQLEEKYKKIINILSFKKNEYVGILECQTRQQDYQNFFLQFSHGPKKEHKEISENKIKHLANENLPAINTTEVKGVTTNVIPIRINYGKANYFTIDEGSLIMEKRKFEGDQLSRFQKVQIFNTRNSINRMYEGIANNHTSKNSFIFPKVCAIFSPTDLEKIVSTDERIKALEKQGDQEEDSSFQAYFQCDGKVATLWRTDK